METQGHDALARFAREHHVHYEVQPEEVSAGGQPELVGVRVRLFATHAAKAKLEAPACPSCAELLGELRSFAEQLLRSDDSASRTEIVPALPKLYQSTEVPDADEVALTVRVHCDSPDHRTHGEGEHRCLGELRERLNAVGVPQR
jgi:hypothetical protein